MKVGKHLPWRVALRPGKTATPETARFIPSNTIAYSLYMCRLMVSLTSATALKEVSEDRSLQHVRVVLRRSHECRALSRAALLAPSVNKPPSTPTRRLVCI